MARRPAAEAALPMPEMNGRAALRYILGLITAALAAVALMSLFWRVEQFVISDARFFLPGPPEAGESSPWFRTEGLFYTSELQVQQVFAKDFGRSLYLCPIAERRRRLLAIDWVKDASVSRIWPNRLVVRITERKPVAFVQIAAGKGAMRPGLIDAEGVLLNPERPVELHLPVVTGIAGDDPEEVRREKVKRFLRLQSELGALADSVSEIDVADIDNVKITEKFDHRTIVLMLGDQKYRQRLQNFLDNQATIRKRMPDAAVLDLRLRDRIIAIGGATRAE
ncbi:MAG TPA: FtsQ-type POTRA domain-containing protein [Bryobacteraceae bacterium]|nr:FtsQ-type POTRA domain-containing protein [Bryobacteraceae bacterium]